ncbi:hypothetical protein HAX54_039711, partial [Datura stramonium]|nr:hypothetical protein [Datura stramonium]
SVTAQRIKKRPEEEDQTAMVEWNLEKESQEIRDKDVVIAREDVLNPLNMQTYDIMEKGYR